MYRKLGLALAFSPTCSALLAETARLMKLYHSKLILIHVGIKDPEKEALLDSLLNQFKIKKEDITIVWKMGKTAKTIIKVCKKEKVDLLIAGALKHETLINYYIGSTARKILRKAPCSVLIFTEPSEKQRLLDEIIIDVEDSPVKSQVIRSGLQQARLGKAKTVHFIRELKLYGLSLSVLSEYSMNEISEQRKNLIYQEIRNIEKSIEDFDLEGLHTTFKIIAGKSGYELRKYAKKVNADLLVLGALKNRLSLIDRLFINNLEYIIQDIPCNLLIVKIPSKKE